MVREYADALLAIGRERGIDVVPARALGGALVPLPLRDGRVAFPSAASARESIDATHARVSGAARALHALAIAARRATGSRRIGKWLEAGPNEDGYLRRAAALSRAAPPAEAIAFTRDDLLYSPDSSWVYDIRSALEAAGRAGAARFVLLHDVLPMSQPQWFSEGTRRWFTGWMNSLISRVEGFVTTTEATRADLKALADAGRFGGRALPPSAAVRLGSEVHASAGEVRPSLAALFEQGEPPAFLTAGTLEPRKNVEFAIDLFDHLDARGLDFHWHIAGSYGWDAGHTAERIRLHPRFGTRLHWWTDLNDAELAVLYRRSAALVAVSRAEGFGLPPVEARLHGTPVFASDIPVFREVLRDEARYLPLGSAPLAAAMLEDFLRAGAPRDDTPSRVARTWRAAAEELVEVMMRMRG